MTSGNIDASWNAPLMLRLPECQTTALKEFFPQSRLCYDLYTIRVTIPLNLSFCVSGCHTTPASAFRLFTWKYNCYSRQWSLLSSISQQHSLDLDSQQEFARMLRSCPFSSPTQAKHADNRARRQIVKVGHRSRICTVRTINEQRADWEEEICCFWSWRLTSCGKAAHSIASLHVGARLFWFCLRERVRCSVDATSLAGTCIHAKFGPSFSEIATSSRNFKVVPSSSCSINRIKFHSCFPISNVLPSQPHMIRSRPHRGASLTPCQKSNLSELTIRVESRKSTFLYCRVVTRPMSYDDLHQSIWDRGLASSLHWKKCAPPSSSLKSC